MSVSSTRTEPTTPLLSASWETYVSLRDMPENLRVRMTFDTDQLELSSWSLFATWETYLALRDDPNNSHLRMTFNQGQLELMSPSLPHERLAYLLGRMIDAWTEERDIDVLSCRSTTLRRADLHHGVEPDNCYYIAHESKVRGKTINLAIDPPPDLAIEVDVTSDCVQRLPTFAALRIPEVWRWTDAELQVLELTTASEYRDVSESRALPGFPLQAVRDLIGEYNQTSETVLLKSFRRLIRSLPAGNS